MRVCGHIPSILINQVNVERCYIFFASGIYLIFFITDSSILFSFMCITILLSADKWVRGDLATRLSEPSPNESRPYEPTDIHMPWLPFMSSSPTVIQLITFSWTRLRFFVSDKRVLAKNRSIKSKSSKYKYIQYYDICKHL